MKKIILFGVFLSFLAFLVGCTPDFWQTDNNSSSGLVSTITPQATENFCLTKEHLEEIKSRPTAFTCNNIDWALAEENVLVSRVYIHEEKQLVPKETCDGIVYYSWKCHPPSYGSLYWNTLWKLRDPDPGRPIKDGDHFDVYVRKDAVAQGYWICGDKRRGIIYPTGSGRVTPTPPTNPLEGVIIQVGEKRAAWIREGEATKEDIENAPPRLKEKEEIIKGKTYDVFSNLLKAFTPDEENFYLVEKGILPEGNENLPEGIFYDVFAISSEEIKEEGKTLKLGTFSFPPPHPWYHAYLPECKPVIYFYPDRELILSLWLSPKGFLSESQPEYLNGWKNLWPLPSGTIFYQGKFYPYLHYEAMIGDFIPPKTGFVVKKENLSSFLDQLLPKLGLNEKEARDFKDYWLSRLVDFPYFQVSLLNQKEIEEIEPVEFSQKPETFLRVRFYFKGLESPIILNPPEIKGPIQRLGFTVVEWGGLYE